MDDGKKTKQAKTNLPFRSKCSAKYSCVPGFPLSLVTGFTSRGVCWLPHLFAVLSFRGRLGRFVFPTWCLFSTPSAGVEGKCRACLVPLLLRCPLDRGELLWSTPTQQPRPTPPVTLSHGCTQLCNLSIVLRVAARIVDVVGFFRICRALCCRLTRLDIGFRSFCCT